MHLKILIFAAVLILLAPNLVLADRGGIAWPETVSLDESAQNAIVAWNGTEEVLILSTDIKSSGPATVLEMMALPSNPTEVKEGNFSSFEKLIEIYNEKIINFRTAGEFNKGDSSGVKITFHKKIGAHDVTIVEVNDLNEFLDWIKNFREKNGFKTRELGSEFKQTITNYLGRKIKYFVFDVIKTAETKKTINPLIYMFKSDFLYYPLEITATSDFGDSWGDINLFFILKGPVYVDVFTDAKLRPGITGYFNTEIRLTREELKQVSPEIDKLFKFGAFVTAAGYTGYLDNLNRDVVINKKDVITYTSLQNKINSLEDKIDDLDYSISKVGTETDALATGFLITTIIGLILIFVLVMVILFKNLGK